MRGQTTCVSATPGPWELQQTGQWQRLEEVLRFMSQFTSQARGLTNLQVCQARGMSRNKGERQDKNPVPLRPCREFSR